MTASLPFVVNYNIEPISVSLIAEGKKKENIFAAFSLAKSAAEESEGSLRYIPFGKLRDLHT